VKIKKIFLIASVIFIIGCDDENSVSKLPDISAIKNISLSNMVFVKGGDFLMGDFGPLTGEKLPLSMHQDDKKLHSVVLSDFAISKFKVTNLDYANYIKLTNKKKPIINSLLEDYPSLKKNDYSVGVTWQQAKDYCLWLGKISSRNIDLPTEAQWEYAARSRGKFLPFATNNGRFEPGKNIPGESQIEKYTDGLGFPFYPIGKYPPNPLGLYDMGLSGTEWTNDWYDPDYYSHSPKYNPTGPKDGVKKVIRGYIGSDRQYALTILRQSSAPVPDFGGSDDYEKNGVSPRYVFRCAMND